MNNKPILRKDVFSGKMLDRDTMIRIVKNKNNQIFIDKTKKANGRGFYIIPSIDALEKIKKNNKLSKSLKSKISQDLYLDLEEFIKGFVVYE